MRSKKALLNFVLSFCLQLISIVSGFIVPILLIKTYGSHVNGMITSIIQFLSYIALLEAGIGGVIRAALYKPLADKDTAGLSGILASSKLFFRKLSYIFVLYILIVAAFYPTLINSNFSGIYIFSLVVILGINTFSQYYFGISSQLLINADQRAYITSVFQIVTIILNVIAVVILVSQNAGIHIVMLFSAILYTLRPLLLSIYVKKRYKINNNIKPNNEAIKQKWDGLGHHIAYYIHSSTDVVLITLFLNVKEVSVYSIYFLVVSGIGKIVRTFTLGVEAAFGNMLAKKENTILQKNFRVYEFISTIITTSLFTAVSILILPFLSIYTLGISDADYYRPVFGYILVLAQAVYCIRLPYHSIVMAAGHFKQTKNGAFMEAGINIFFSLILINSFGILGVALGTLIAVSFRTLQYVHYLSKNIIFKNVMEFYKRIFLNICSVIIVLVIASYVPEFEIDSYTNWFIYAVGITIISILVTFTTNSIVYKKDLKNLAEIVKRLFLKNKKSK